MYVCLIIAWEAVKYTDSWTMHPQILILDEAQESSL